MITHQLNLYAAILHYVLALSFTIYFISLNKKYPNDPVQGVELTMRDHAINIAVAHCNTPNVGNCDASGNTVTANWVSQPTATVGITTIQTMLIAFFLITGSFHLFYYLSAGPLEDGDVWGNSYTRAIANHNNFFRWIEYSITSTLMLYIIAFISGVKDTNIYMLLFATNIAMIYTGQLVEEYKRDDPKSTKWVLPMIVGFVMLFAEFAVIIRDFRNRINQVSTFLNNNVNNPDPDITHGRTIPSWISATIYSLFIFFSCFGFISLVGAYFDVRYELIENAYIVASFAAKATLGMFIAYGTGQRQSAAR